MLATGTRARTLPAERLVEVGEAPDRAADDGEWDGDGDVGDEVGLGLLGERGQFAADDVADLVLEAGDGPGQEGALDDLAVQSANLRPVTLGSFSTLRSWLSQWSVADTNAHGPTCLESVSVPVLVAYGTGDKGCFPSMATALYDAARHPDKKLLPIPGAGHYFEGPAHLLTDTLDSVVDWLR